MNNWAAASPQLAEPKVELARLLEEVGQPEQAKAQLVNALTVEPHNARALTALGRLRDQSGESDQALVNYQRSLSLNRFQPEVAARVAQLQSAADGARRSRSPGAAGPCPSWRLAADCEVKWPQSRSHALRGNAESGRSAARE